MVPVRHMRRLLADGRGYRPAASPDRHRRPRRPRRDRPGRRGCRGPAGRPGRGQRSDITHRALHCLYGGRHQSGGRPELPGQRPARAPVPPAHGAARTRRADPHALPGRPAGRPRPGHVQREQGLPQHAGAGAVGGEPRFGCRRDRLLRGRGHDPRLPAGRPPHRPRGHHPRTGRHGGPGRAREGLRVVPGPLNKVSTVALERLLPKRAAMAVFGRASAATLGDPGRLGRRHNGPSRSHRLPAMSRNTATRP
jgi:hypothetical protein